MLRIILGGPDYDSLQRGSDVGAGTYVFLVTKSSGLEEIEGPTASSTARVLVSFLMSCPPSQISTCNPSKLPGQHKWIVPVPGLRGKPSGFCPFTVLCKILSQCPVLSE